MNAAEWPSLSLPMTFDGDAFEVEFDFLNDVREAYSLARRGAQQTTGAETATDR